ncbi:MAG: hypothetical protein KGZ93_02295 [Actinobacteria bacterium]|nr:hypothetical protein [Actinomycetota bacterium]
MQFNPEDEQLGGPRCRNCHRGSSGCGGCHNANDGVNPSLSLTREQQEDLAASNVDYKTGMWRSDITQFFRILMGDPNHADSKAYTLYNLTKTSDGQANQISQAISDAYLQTGIIKQSRSTSWGANSGWRTDPNKLNVSCSDDGLSWPHRTLGWKMLKDDLFGIDVIGLTDGTSKVIGVGETRTFGGYNAKTHDLDSVCLDCHNPTIWNATSASDHVDNLADPNDDMDDDVMLRGLP